MQSTSKNRVLGNEENLLMLWIRCAIYYSIGEGLDKPLLLIFQESLIHNFLLHLHRFYDVAIDLGLFSHICRHANWNSLGQRQLFALISWCFTFVSPIIINLFQSLKYWWYGDINSQCPEDLMLVQSHKNVLWQILYVVYSCWMLVNEELLDLTEGCSGGNETVDVKAFAPTD